MDSCNSGSLQSSSGGDDEYDSRAAADTAFTHQQQQPPVFDPLSNYIQLHQNPNPFTFNPDMAWPRPTSPGSDLNPIPTFVPSFQPPIAANNACTNKMIARNPKKRSRASRRAPTTVLTTDTTNFRAMVQEFTGIASPPFNTSSLTRTRLDLIGTRSAAVDTPAYLRRPFLAYSTTTSNDNNAYNIQNPLLTSLLQTNPKFVFSNSSTIASKPSFQMTSSHDIKAGSLQEFDLSHVTSLSELPSLISSDQNSNINARNWRNLDDNYEGQMRSVNSGAYNFPRAS